MYNPHFSHIYVETDAYAYADTRRALERFPKAKVVEIDHYKDLFDRSGQEWREQKKSQKLILAVRRDHFLYDGTDIAPNFGNKRFFYNALVLNCIYDCDYCYLQGMFRSANAVMFVNNDDYFAAVRKELTNGPIYLAISYDTDLMAFEHILPYCNRWIDFARSQPDLAIELRTKSANYRAIREQKPAENVILAWTLSPQPVTEQYEKKTPPLASRIRAVRQALDDGWQVRLCFDPVMQVPNWREVYGEMVEQVHRAVDLNRIKDVSIGVFRMSSGYLKAMRKQRQDSDVLYYPYETTDGVASYPDAVKNELEHFVAGQLAERMEPEKIDVI